MLQLFVLAVGLCGSHDAPIVFVDRDPGARQPQVAVDSAGRVFVAYGLEGEIRCAASSDGGKRFAKPATVAQVSKLALGMRRGPRVAATDKAVILTAVVRESAAEEAARNQDPDHPPYMNATGEVMAWRSVDGGTTWSKPSRLNRVPASAREGLHALAARPDGLVFCVWLDLREDAMTLYGARSDDDGATWHEDTLIYRSPAKQICTCCHPSLAFAPDGNLVVMWRDDIGGARDMYMLVYDVKENRAGAAQKLGRRSWTLSQCPMDGGAITCTADGKVVNAWMRAGEVYSCESGKTEVLLGSGVQPWIATGARGADTHVVWLEHRPGKLLLLGPNGQGPQTLTNSANDPVIASGPVGREPVVAAWEATGEQRGIAVKVIEPQGE